ncbi:hypothetical protein RIF29_18787 [Crotalaria pallida]|uniref:Uncharacterized protein n=1 Tax=Crotalaria pallida TaxID=3830 RepID=A0AAN9EY80_CROPI
MPLGLFRFLLTGIPDEVIWAACTDGTYSISSRYKWPLCDSNDSAPSQSCSWIWRIKVPEKLQEAAILLFEAKKGTMWWTWLRRKGGSGFSASSTAEEVTHGIDATGLTAIVTG